jgi:hypothetical protein
MSTPRRRFTEGHELPGYGLIEDTGWYVFLGGQWQWDEYSQRADGKDDRPAIERYGTPEHEMWLIEMERRNDYQ